MLVRGVVLLVTACSWVALGFADEVPLEFRVRSEFSLGDLAARWEGPRGAAELQRQAVFDEVLR